MDSFFSKGFKAAKCKTLLKLTIPRLKLLRNRREIQIKQMRREIAKLLETGQEATARIRVEHIIREEKMMGAQEIVELFCELITVRLPIIEAQRDCPLDLKEAISSVCFAAPRCADLPELLQVQMLFAGKYGREFVSSATELMPECGVNRQLIELLSIRPPAPDVKLKLLKEIAEEHELEWDPSASKSELFKTHEDLLNGSKVPLPEPQHDNATADELSDSDEDFDIIDFSEVPSQPLQANKKGRVSTPVMMPFPASALSDDDDHEEPIPSLINKEVSKVGHKQFLPFIHPPSQSIPVRELSPPPSIIDTENENVGLEDVLAAALEAAETAEHAAAAARCAASLAQLRISVLMRKKNDEVLSSSDENPSHLDKSKPWQEENDDQVSLGDGRGLFTSPSYEDSNEDFDSSHHSNSAFSHGSHHKPQRLHSMDDETCFSYPNLFTSQGSNPTPHVQSFRDSK